MSESIDTAVILAAGLGTRMRSTLPKVLHQVCGLPLITHVTRAAAQAGVERLVVVLRPGQEEELAPHLPPSASVAVQKEQRGTGDALLAAGAMLGDGHVLVLPGDTPLLTADILTGLVRLWSESGADAALLTLTPPDPTGYGRVLRDPEGMVERIVEHRDATPAEREVREVNAAVYILPAREALELLAGLDRDNDQGELYLTDVIAGLRSRGARIAALCAPDHRVALGINNRVELAEAQGIMGRRILEAWMLAGVTIEDPGSTHVDAGVELEPDVHLLPFTCLRGTTRVARGSEIGPGSTLVDTVVGAGSFVRHSYTNGAVLEAGAQVGPFTYLRPGANLLEGAKAGAFVEIKKSTIGKGSKVPHLSYIGDTRIGSGTNIGAGNITANYDGFEKHPTSIGDNVRTGSDAVFVAPVTVGDEATVGAGSIITKDVPAGALAVARSRQRNILEYRQKGRTHPSSEDAMRGGAAAEDHRVASDEQGGSDE
ncbi:MAG TPA: bifunctional UDP-N-acetylglucosamine diphosphorylase/glucosamine-1-phosphate N-acetyltransferase GlmU [Thermoleophilia bacterium]|nr:bifunctional UDP-N-acetylglucosamine diphosphorylase/glucosamine-1-phosphate N-acetyltransferase GlmU [Thermoleophilia bacterium]